MKTFETVFFRGFTDTKTKGLMIGHHAQNLREYEKIAQKYFSDLKEIKVI